MTAVVSSGEILKVAVRYEGSEQLCSGYMKLKGEIEFIKREIAEEKRRREVNELTVIIGDIVGALNQVLFATAKELHMPKEVLILRC
jgi:hypothetical protein